MIEKHRCHRILEILAAHDDRTAGEIFHLINLNASATTYLLQAMEFAGYCESFRVARGGIPGPPLVHWRITPGGRAKLATVAELWLACEGGGT